MDNMRDGKTVDNQMGTGQSTCNHVDELVSYFDNITMKKDETNSIYHIKLNYKEIREKLKFVQRLLSRLEHYEKINNLNIPIKSGG